jgi:hypothetical protein
MYVCIIYLFLFIYFSHTPYLQWSRWHTPLLNFVIKKVVHIHKVPDNICEKKMVFTIDKSKTNNNNNNNNKNVWTLDSTLAIKQSTQP